MHQRYIIGVTGGSGSGKTSLLLKLRSAFHTSELAILTQDNYYRKLEDQQVDEQGVENFDLPESIELDTFCEDLLRLGHGESVERMEYTYNNKHIPPSVLRIEPAPVIVAEGLFMMHDDKIRSLLDLAVFVDVNDVLKLKRRILRDRVERNYPLEDVLYRYEHHVLPSYRQYIMPYRDHADIVINNNITMEPGIRVVVGHIRDRLASMR